MPSRENHQSPTTRTFFRSTPNLFALSDELGLHNDDDDDSLASNGKSPAKSSLTASSKSVMIVDPTVSQDIGRQKPSSSRYENESTWSSQSKNNEVSPVKKQRSNSSRSTSTSAGYLYPSAAQLFPPFYGRPTTPLPPSPSLTSLLRPPFSTHTSHQTTPESSDIESTTGGTYVSVAEKNAQNTITVTRASPKVPTYEYYGFTLYLTSSASFVIYLLWAYLPSPFLHQLGIHYYPNRWWALAVPSWIIVSLMYIYVALASYNTGYLTLPVQSIENFIDETAQIAIIDRDGKIIRPKKTSRFAATAASTIVRSAGRRRCRQDCRGVNLSSVNQNQHLLSDVSGIDWRAFWDEGTDAVMDIPMGGVCEILYGSARESS